jgi:hypothetical protein
MKMMMIEKSIGRVAMIAKWGKGEQKSLLKMKSLKMNRRRRMWRKGMKKMGV